MKNYTAHYLKKDILLANESQKLIGKIIDESSWFKIQHSIDYSSRTYEIKNVGFLKNDVELSLSKRIIYFTDLGKDRIIKSGQEVRIYNFKLDRINQLFEKGKLLIEICKAVKKETKEAILEIKADNSVEDLLILLFLHYSTKEFNGISGDD
ncbi:hypothetical protein OF897_04410 [Chryseobacterium formosus]|uniref:Uncharacterized protein n=1 Tax=Chryseobacterium formosus TaxID=1537363 RepID=A0ABT3XSR5_9FLAO|nr:hypothetical protein [Chryseobacterium formosus]MCX8523164.1 hypothetical protein [Chryseobacterium formosus]